MSRMLRFCAIVLLAGLAFSMVAGCGCPRDENTNGEEAAAAEE